MNNQNNTDVDINLENLLKKLIPFVVVIAGLLIVFYIFSFHKLPMLENPAAWGSFGDYIGGILNPIISFCTLLIAYSVWKLQKKEMVDTKKALEDQAKTSEQQRREQRFFDLLNLYQFTVSSLQYRKKSHESDRVYQGKAVFNALLIELPDYVAFASERYRKSDLAAEFLSKHLMQDDARLSENAKKGWKEINEVLLPHFRITLSVLYELEKLLKDDHFRYAKLLRSQITPCEAIFLGCYLSFSEDNSALYELVKKYAFLHSSNEMSSYGDLLNFLKWHIGEEAFVISN